MWHLRKSSFGPTILNNPLNLANERQLLKSLLTNVSLRSKAEHDIETRHTTEVAAEQQQYQSVFQVLTENYDAERTQLDLNRETKLAAIEEQSRQQFAQIQSQYRNILVEIEDRFTDEMALATKERDEAVWLVSSLLDDDSEGSPLQRLQQAQANVEAIEIELTTGLQSLDQGYNQAVQFLKSSHIWSEPNEPDPSVRMSNVEAMKSACLEAIQAGDPLHKQIISRMLPRLFFGALPFILFLVIGLVLFGIVWGLVDPSLLQLKLKSTDRDWGLIAGGISAAISLLVTFFLHLSASHKAWPDYESLLQKRVDAHYAYSVWEKISKTELNMLEAECSRLHELRVKRRESALAGADSKFRARTTEAQRVHSNGLQQAHANFPARLNGVESRRATQKDEVETKYQADTRDLDFRRHTDFQQLQSAFDARMAECRNLYQRAWLDLIRAWQTNVKALGEHSDFLCSEAKAICPDWGMVARDEFPFPERSPANISLGLIHADLDLIEGGVSADPRLKTDRQRFDLPILLPLRERPSLVMKATGFGRDVAVKTLQSTMLRYLTSLPPGKVRFTILDPVGLGANFAAFMHLADYDELLVSSRIWTEPSHIEKRLADLTEHMETVLQTYLRNEFATIDEYNEFAGEVAEPYRVLVVANFPANFTDVALRRLLSIADGGSRCGVYVLLSFDQSQEIPRGFSPADLEKYATVLKWTEEGEFRLEDPDFAKWPLILDQPPAAEMFGQIVRLAGQHSRDVRRVEVPFERVAPTEDQFWASDSRKGIEIPVGRAGATKLQYLRLGKGTSQHVLVAGKTGSGKSTLLHALITNLSLYYSPTEVEFYLIDFKKGVEFKVYAEQRIPHARVIAIESDREFGVSVLERLDALLRDRGELFREAGVQDIAGFRDARPGVVMPRTLLLVDEFQEFFVEDDAMSQQAALLLDRLIRQGRAFGVHILLGSQTLAGAYSLARSTLGQVAVRIALQCSETDAHLILSEENTAARLLTRPGEAIYNDANGLIEGNHPFQIVWLDEQVREGYLHLIRDEARGEGDRSRCTDDIRTISQTPPLFFEGNIAADPTTNRRLQRVLTKCRQTMNANRDNPVVIEETWSCWLGDSVSMGGPIELSFGLRDGGNVLIVGRDEQAALGVMATSALAISAQAAAAGANATVVHLLDGSLPNSESGQSWRQLSRVFTTADASIEAGGIIGIWSPRETLVVLNNLIEELHRRSDEPGPPLFLFVYDLARFRDLRKADDDFGFGGFGGGGEKAVNPGQLFNELLRDGPAAGIFTFAWVDSYQTAQRWLARDQMNRFEQRIIFAMNANDSSSLVDSPAAGRLGENRALLYRGDLGTLEKFRPYSPPATDWIKQLASAMPRLSQPMPKPAADVQAVEAVRNLVEPQNESVNLSGDDENAARAKIDGE